MGSWEKLKADMERAIKEEKQIATSSGYIAPLSRARVDQELHSIKLRALVEIAGNLDSIAADLKALRKNSERGRGRG